MKVAVGQGVGTADGIAVVGTDDGVDVDGLGVGR
jgi:hypothetical protein